MRTTEQNSFPNEHGCRLRDPDDFRDDTFRSMDREHDGKHYRVIMAKLHGEDTMTEQSYRYPIEEWDEKDARRHCKDHGGKLFEKAED